MKIEINEENLDKLPVEVYMIISKMHKSITNTDILIFNMELIPTNISLPEMVFHSPSVSPEEGLVKMEFFVKEYRTKITMEMYLNANEVLELYENLSDESTEELNRKGN